MSGPRALARHLVGWALGWVFAGALYLLLIDTISLPELLVGAGGVTLAATAFELTREHSALDAGFRGSWLARVYRPLLNVPRDIVWVSLEAMRQLARRDAQRGEFRSARFRCGAQERESAREALAESLGSFAPNTIVIGVDLHRELILVHQLRVSGGREAIDVLELG
jgi:hypothetical protein